MRFLRNTFITAFLIFTISAGYIAAEETTISLTDAKALSGKDHKPLLMEFFRSDCEYCQKAAQQAETSDLMKDALESVIHVPLNVREGEGIDLSDKYRVGMTYPVFILANSNGDVIRRWVGFNSAGQFVGMLRMSLADTTTIDNRVKNFEHNPTAKDALFLAGYYADTKDYLKAADYYRRAKKLGGSPGIDYDYNIFQNMASAAWDRQIPFEDVLPSADSVLALKNKRPESVIKMARIISRVARKLDKTDDLRKYIQAGLDLTAKATDNKNRSYHQQFQMDYVLHVEHDTTRAIGMKKASLGDGWETSPDKFYDFAEWCLERKINLEEARKFAVQATEIASAGVSKGRTIKTAAEIYDAMGDTKKAVGLMEEAMEQDPSNSYYEELWNDFRRKLQGRK
jgi:tetratricopeptide (TPR) repeat protein